MRHEPLVREFMTSPVTSLSPSSSLLDAALLLRSSAIRHIPIVDEGRLVGIITDRDVQRHTPSLLAPVPVDDYNALFENTPISRLMTREPVHVSADMPLHEAADLLRSRKLGCLPVVDNQKLVGIITKADMLTALLHLLEAPTAVR